MERRLKQFLCYEYSGRTLVVIWSCFTNFNFSVHQEIFSVEKEQSGLYSSDFPKCYFLQIHSKIRSKVPIFYFNRPKRPP